MNLARRLCRTRFPAPLPGCPPVKIHSLAFLIGAALIGCQTSSQLEASADSETERILRDKSATSVDLRPQTVILPEVQAEPVAPESSPSQPPISPDAGSGAGAPALPTAPLRVLSLHEALLIAVTSGRDYMTRKESLYLTALGLTGTRYEFGPRLTAALSYTFANADNSVPNHAAIASAGVAQKLPWGGDVALDARQNFNNNGGAGTPRAFDSGVAIVLTQPLLRGFGPEVANEALTQAERSTLYAIREFELFREDYSIRVASSYYDLVQQKQTVANQRRNMQNLAEERRKAEALFQVGRKTELELLRAKRSELTSKNDLIEGEENLRLALDRFRIFLGLPDDDRVDVQPEEPAFIAVNYNVNSAIQCALANRLDFLNERDQLDDAARSLRISKNGLLPELNLNAGFDLNADADPTFTNQALDRESYSAALTLRLPVDRLLDRNAWKSAQIGYRQALRSFQLFEDEMVVAVQSTFRELERRKESVEIQRELILSEEKNLRIAQILFEKGDNSNRDVVDAQQSLLDARNSLISEQVGYEIARLGLLRDLGVLFIDENGAWKE